MLESKYFVSNIQNLTIKQDEQRFTRISNSRS